MKGVECAFVLVTKCRRVRLFCKTARYVSFSGNNQFPGASVFIPKSY